MAALVVAYKGSADWSNLRPATKTDYLKVLDPLQERFGHLAVATMPREFVLSLRDEYASKDGKPTPRRANRFIAVLRLLLSWGVDRGWRKDNPALRPKLLRTGAGYRSWNAQEVRTFLDSATPELRLASLLAVCTGQRKGDLLRMPWTAYDGSGVELVQAKTGARLWVPAHRALRDALDCTQRRAVTILTRPDGRPWGEDHFNHAFGAAVKEAGLEGLVFHGLRHTAATWLAEAGCTPHQIAAITGHKTLAMVARYTEQAGQRQRATAAIRRLERSGPDLSENGAKTPTVKRGVKRKSSN